MASVARCSSVAGLKTPATLRYTSVPVATATTCYGYATVLRLNAAVCGLLQISGRATASRRPADAARRSGPTVLPIFGCAWLWPLQPPQVIDEQENPAQRRCVPPHNIEI